MVGSVAMAAGVGVLPNPFGGDEPGRPAATVSAAESRDPLLASPSPDGGTRGKSVPSLGPTPPGGSGDRGSAGRDEPQADPTDGGQGSRSDMSLPGDWRGGLASSCRDMRSGKNLEAERRRALEKAAKGSKNVPKYCENALRHEPAVRSDAGTGTGTDTGEGRGDIGADGGQSGAGDNGGKGDGATGGNGWWKRPRERPGQRRWPWQRRRSRRPGRDEADAHTDVLHRPQGGRTPQRTGPGRRPVVRHPAAADGHLSPVRRRRPLPAHRRD